jgi:hypothetical protein
MANGKSAGRAVGIVLLVQMAGSYLVNFTLLEPLTAAQGGLLASAASNPLRVGLWGLVGLAVGATSLVLAIAAWPVLRRASPRWALWVVALGAVSLALQVVEHVGLLSVLSLSEARASAVSAPAGLYEAVALLARSLRNWMHFSGLVLVGAMYFGFYAALWRDRLVPRLLAGLGLLASLLQMGSVAQPFLGHEVIFPLLAPMGLAHLLLALWLLWRGFAEPTPQALAPGSPATAPLAN